MAALSINVSNVLRSSSGVVFTGTAGQAVTAGQPLYYDSTTTSWKLANALSNNPVGGIAVAGAAANQDLAICSRDPNFQPGYVINAGNIAILGNVAGQVNDVADRATGWYVTVLGVGIGGNRVNMSLVGANGAF